MEQDARLLGRVRDLSKSLGEDLDWLIKNHFADTPRADGLRDLGERLAELGADLLKRADQLDQGVAAKLPESGWIPEAGPPANGLRVAHYVGRGELRFGLVYLAACGAACYPFYGKDPTARIARHPTCGVCPHLGEEGSA
ncbi:MAG: hypothetical protein QOI21_6199 [Actinomycetota bacterium]|jgi:hypothetical protein|nr:hypothetical protein [Actinomycetota bacterium]